MAYNTIYNLIHSDEGSRIKTVTGRTSGETLFRAPKGQSWLNTIFNQSNSQVKGQGIYQN